MDRASSRLYVFGGMTTVLLIIALTNLGAVVAGALGASQLLGVGLGLGLAFALSRLLLRWLVARATSVKA